MVGFALYSGGPWRVPVNSWLKLHVFLPALFIMILTASTTMTSSNQSFTNLFDGLLEQSRKLREETDAAELPPIQLGLGEIERRAKEIKKTGAAARKDTRA